jgi:hypothetical protein
MALFDNAKSKSSVKLHYGDPKKARETIRRLRKLEYVKQYRAASSMYRRAKYHAHQTEGMRESMKIYAKFLKSISKN